MRTDGEPKTVHARLGGVAATSGFELSATRGAAEIGRAMDVLRA